MAFWRFGNVMLRVENIEAILFDAEKVQVFMRSGRFYACPKEHADQWLKALVELLKLEDMAKAAAGMDAPPAPQERPIDPGYDTRIGQPETT